MERISTGIAEPDVKPSGRYPKMEGIIPAPESAYTVAHVKKAAETGKFRGVVVINLTGRGNMRMWTRWRG